jgi:hypothetical protein
MDVRDNERELWGNGTLTVAARIASAFGVPTLIAVVLWLGSQVWDDVRSLREDKVELASTLAALGHKIDEQHRWNVQQDARIERLMERSPPPRAPRD